MTLYILRMYTLETTWTHFLNVQRRIMNVVVYVYIYRRAKILPLLRCAFVILRLSIDY